MTKLFKSTWTRVVGAAVGAVLVAFLVVGVAPQSNEVLGQTVPVQDLVDVDLNFDEETGCMTLVITFSPDFPGAPNEGRVIEHEVCFPTFRFF